jgi:hypothetical protein
MRLQFKNPWANRLQTMLWRHELEPIPLAPVRTASTGAVDAEWDEAFLRVESYLRAHQIESRVLLNELTTEIINAARLLAEEDPTVPPVSVAMRVLQARIGAWLEGALGDGHWADERFRARGRLAILLARLPQTAPQQLLSKEPIPPELAARLSGARLQPGPELRLTGMTSAPLEFPLAEVAEEKWTTFSGSTFFRATASWLLFAGFLGLAWFATR